MFDKIVKLQVSAATTIVIVAISYIPGLVLETKTPLGIAAGLVFLVPILLSALSRNARIVLLATSGSSIMVIVGGLISPSQDIDTSYFVFNRGLTAVTVMFVGITLSAYLRLTAQQEQTNANLNAIFQDNPDPTCFIDSNFDTILRANTAFALLIERSINNIEGNGLNGLLNELDLIKLKSALKDLTAQRRTDQIEINLLRPAGHMPAIVSIQAYLSASSKINSFRLTWHTSEELTRTRNELQTEEQCRKQIVESALDAVIAIDQQGVVFDWNPAAKAIFGWRRDEAIGANLSNLIIPQQLREAHKAGMNRFLTTGVSKVLDQRIELPAISKSGREFSVEISINALKTETGWNFSAYLRDLSQREKLAQAEENVELQKTRRQLIVDASLDAIVAINEDNIVHDWNSAAEDLFGWTADEAIGRELGSLIIPEIYRQEHRQGLSRYINAGDSRILDRRREVIAHNRDGREFPIEIAVSAIPIGDNWEFCAYLRDISAEKAQRLTEARLAAIVGSTKDAIIGYTLDGIITSWNKGAEDLYGYTEAEALGRSMEMLMPNQNMLEQLEILKDVRLGKSVVLNDAARRTKSGDNIIVAVTISPVLDSQGNVQGASALARDVSDQIAAQKQLEYYTRELERSNTDLGMFAYSASHDLRAPLRGIQQVAEWTLEDFDKDLSQDVLDRLNLIQQRAKRLDKLLEDLLAYSRVGKSNEPLEAVNCNELVHEIVDSLNISSDFDIRLELLPTLQCSKAPLMQIFANLISNAVKHHDRENGVISISSELEGDRVIFHVRDDGPGIAPEHHEQIFEIFRTLRPLDEVEGSGMGLALVAKNLRNFDSQISVKSKVGEGATFSFDWPITTNITS